MFQDILKIPIDEIFDATSYGEIQRNIAPIYTSLSNLYAETYFTSCYTYDHALRAIEELSSYIDGMNCEENDCRTIEAEYSRNAANFHWLFESSEYSNCIGLVINVDSEPHFNEWTWTDAVFLDAAAEALKLDPKQFMRVFHRKDNPNMLFIWTRRVLKPSQYYKAKVLQNRLNKTNLEHFNEYTEQIYTAMEKNDLKKLNETFRAFMESDYVKDKEYKLFIKTFTRSKKNSQTTFERKIKEAYKRIREYENNIASEGARIEELNRKLYALMYNQKTDDEIGELYKYLLKHRNIQAIEMDGDRLILSFKAPLVYYTDYAIEKIIRNYKPTDPEYKILQLFLKRDFELITECRIAFYPDNFNIEPYYRRGGDANIIGHPHIDQYGCLGNHREGVNESAETEDYIGAIEQINQAVMNMNFYDACVTNYLLRLLKSEDTYDVNMTWKDKTTGEMITTAEAIRRSESNEEA